MELGRLDSGDSPELQEWLVLQASGAQDLLGFREFKDILVLQALQEVLDRRVLRGLLVLLEVNAA